MEITGPSQRTRPSREEFGPSKDRYDVVIVGARAAGASTAMLLARHGLSVLAVDRSAYGSDTLSTHALSKAGVLLLSRWGILDRLRAAGTPAARTLVFRYGGQPLRIDLSGSGDVDGLYSPRRTLLDAELVDAARRSGAEICHGVSVAAVTSDQSGRVDGVDIAVHGGKRHIAARIVVGADGVRSRVAAVVGAKTLVEDPSASSFILGYRTGLPCDVIENDYSAKGKASGVIPTNDGLACVWVGMTQERFRVEGRGKLEAAFRAEVAGSPRLSSLLAGTEQVGALRGFAGAPGFLRSAHGPGWALVGDAGYFKDPVSAHGITDAFVGAELLSVALGQVFLNGVDESDALGEYQRQRDLLAASLMPPISKLARLDFDGSGAAAAFIEMNAALKQEWELLHSQAVSQPVVVC